MRVKLSADSPKAITMIILGAIAVVTALVAAWFYHSATTAAARYESARNQYSEDVALAAKFRKLSAEAIAFSADTNEARSSTFLQGVVQHAHVNAPSIYSDAEETSGSLTRIKTHVDCDGTPLASIVSLVREIESGRANLALLSAFMERQEGASDSWNARLVYLALIRAK